MNIEFKIRNDRNGMKQTWDGYEDVLNDYILDDGDNFKDQYSDVQLCDVVTDYRKLVSEEPIFTEIIKIPADLCNIRELIEWWDEAPEGWRKSFVYLYQELGDYSTRRAMEAAPELVWTGVKYNGDLEEENFEKLGRYYADKLGVTVCLEGDQAFDFAKFGVNQMNRLSGQLDACLTFGEWVETGDYPDAF